MLNVLEVIVSEFRFRLATVLVLVLVCLCLCACVLVNSPVAVTVQYFMLWQILQYT